MDKLITYLKDKLHLSDEIVEIVLANIKVKYVVPTYYFGDKQFTDLNVLDDEEDQEFYNTVEFNESELSVIIYNIIANKGFHLIPKKGLFSLLKVDEEYWAIYKSAPPIHVVVEYIEQKSSWAWYIYNYIAFKNKVTNKRAFSFYDEEKEGDELYLFPTREEAVKFYKDKFDLN